MLLFNGGEILKIGDMGLSKVIGEESMTATKGTMKYMSPGSLLLMKSTLSFSKRRIKL